MGNKLCCDAKIVRDSNIESGASAEQLILQFMKTNPSISEVCQRPGEIYGSVDKKQIIYYQNGKYIGKTANRKRNGLGLMLFKDNMYYEGQWIDDSFQGRGKFIFSQGDFYDGQWKNSLPEGDGLYVSRNPIWRYEGHWEAGIQNGKGKEVFEDSSYYQGDFQKGLRHGRGIFKNHDGRFYEGSFLNGQAHGFVRAVDFQFAYEGEFKNGEMDGTGKSFWQEGQQNKKKVVAQYIGEYKGGRKNGFGEYRSAEGVVYKGKWNNGLTTNQGVMIKKENPNIL